MSVKRIKFFNRTIKKFNKKSGHAVLAMITSQHNPDWPLDVPITGSTQTGLKAPSKVRMKLFTLDIRLMVKKIGTLTTADKDAVVHALRGLLAGQHESSFSRFGYFVLP
jgi:mRNA interferase MazF